jgi:histone deacetylase complex regulatory component SIN3
MSTPAQYMKVVQEQGSPTPDHEPPAAVVSTSIGGSSPSARNKTAVQFLARVKTTFAQQPEVYTNVVTILIEFRDKRVSCFAMVDRVCHLRTMIQEAP